MKQPMTLVLEESTVVRASGQTALRGTGQHIPSRGAQRRADPNGNAGAAGADATKGLA
jgi:hypothetical protein